MTSKRKVHGYIDRAALREAVDVNEHLTRLLPEVIDELGWIPRGVGLKLQRVGFELARQRVALARMEQIRGDRKGERV